MLVVFSWFDNSAVEVLALEHAGVEEQQQGDWSVPFGHVVCARTPLSPST